MANSNTFGALYNLTGPTSATETAIAAVAGGTVRAVLGVRNDVSGGLFDGRPFKVRVVSSCVATGAGNFTVNLYWNVGTNTNLTTFTSDVLVIGSGAIAAASKPCTSFMEATVIWDSALQQLAGFWNEAAGLNNLITTPAVVKTSAAIVANTTLASGLTNVSQIQFFVTHTCSANITSSKLVELAIDAI